MPNPIKKQIADQIINLLENYAPFAAVVLPGNLANQATDGWLRNILARAPGQYPRVSLSNAGTTYNGFEQRYFYGMEGGSYPGAESSWLTTRVYQYALTITGRDLKSTSIDPIESAAQNAIDSAGKYLGLPAFVRDLLPRNAPQRQVADGPDGVQRLQSIIMISVQVELLGKAAMVAEDAA